MSARDDKNPTKSTGAKLWVFLNSSFGLFLLSSVVLSLVTWMYTEVSQSIEQRIVNADKATKLDTEISYRIRLLNSYFKSDCSDHTKVSRDTFVDIQDIYKADPAFQAIFPDNRQKDLHVLIWEKAALLGTDEKETLVGAFNSLLLFNAYLTRFLRQTSSDGAFYGTVPNLGEEVDRLIEMFTAAVHPITGENSRLVTQTGARTVVEPKRVDAAVDAKSDDGRRALEVGDAGPGRPAGDEAQDRRALPQAAGVVERTKPHVNVGAIGHAEFGDAKVTSAITKVLADSGDAVFVSYEEIRDAPEEKSRGITISTAHVEYATQNRHFAHVSCPTVSDCMKSMILGAAQMDGAILVVSATEGPTASTREVVSLSAKVGIPALVVYLNLDGELRNEELDSVERDTRALVREYGYSGTDTPVVRGSAQAALDGSDDEIGRRSILALLNKVDSYIPQPDRLRDKPFLLPIEDVFVISGRGTVVTGRVERGIVRVGDDIEIVGIKDTRKAVVTGVEMFRKLLDLGEAGDNIGAVLQDVGRKDVERGQVLAKPGSITPHTRFKAEVYILSKEEGGRHTPFFANYRPQFYFRKNDMTGAVTLPEGTEKVMPGDIATIEVKLVAPIAMDKGLRFAIREGGRTVGAGVVTAIYR